MTSGEDREDGVENRQAKRDRDKIDRLAGVIRRIQSNGHVLANVVIRCQSQKSLFCFDPGVLANVGISVCSKNSPQPCLDPPKSEWHDGQRQINEAGKCIMENTALRTKFRGGVRVQACHAAV